jgi:putative endonuclease
MPRIRPALALMERTLALLDRANVRLGRVRPRTPAQQRGADGERAAYFHLRRLGFVVVARQWRHALLDGEADLIAWEGKTLCVVEIKTRDASTTSAAEMAVSRDQQTRLRRLADAYIRQLPWTDGEPQRITPRFDVVSVYTRKGERPQIQLHRDYFR